MPLCRCFPCRTGRTGYRPYLRSTRSGLFTTSMMIPTHSHAAQDNALGVVGQWRNSLLWTAPNQHYHHCAGVLWTTSTGEPGTAGKRPRRTVVRYLHDNARPHVAKLTREKLIELGWEVLIHPPYSPDLAPSDYHLFNSLSSHMRGKQFEICDQVDAALADFSTSKPRSFYKSGIEKLYDRWQQVLLLDGANIFD